MREEEAYTMMNVRKDKAQMSIVYNTLEQKRKMFTKKERKSERERVKEIERASYSVQDQRVQERE